MRTILEPHWNDRTAHSTAVLYWWEALNIDEVEDANDVFSK